MKIGIIGTGEVGSTLTRRLTRLRHTVSIANSRGPGSAAPAITSFTPPITGFGQTATSGPSRPTLADLAKETGAHAVTVTDAVKNVDLVDELGFDGVDAGSLDESWRQQPGTPVYCTNLDADGVRRTLRQADRAKAPEERERSLAEFAKLPAGSTSRDMVLLQRRLFGLSV